ncbi:MAG: hypothetical protein AAF385_00220 [Pseudomonadota bacterium]
MKTVRSLRLVTTTAFLTLVAFEGQFVVIYGDNGAWACLNLFKYKPSSEH